MCNYVAIEMCNTLLRTQKKTTPKVPRRTRKVPKYLKKTHQGPQKSSRGPQKSPPEKPKCPPKDPRSPAEDLKSPPEDSIRTQNEPGTRWTGSPREHGGPITTRDLVGPEGD